MTLKGNTTEIQVNGKLNEINRFGKLTKFKTSNLFIFIYRCHHMAYTWFSKRRIARRKTKKRFELVI